MIKAPTRLLLGHQRKHFRVPVTISYLETCVSFLFSSSVLEISLHLEISLQMNAYDNESFS